MKKRALILSGVSVVAAAAVIMYGTTLFPGRKIQAFEESYLRPQYDFIGEGSRFTEYDVTLENGHLLETEDFSLMLPNQYTKEAEEGTEKAIYWVQQEEDVVEFVAVFEPTLPLASAMQSDPGRNFDVNLPTPDDLEEGYEKLCGAYPESEYEMFKYMALLDLEEFDASDYDKAYAFCQLASLKCVYCSGADPFVYENDKICGILYDCADSVKVKSDQKHYVMTFAFYDRSDLNHRYTIQIVSPSMDTIYGVINSITMK